MGNPFPAILGHEGAGVVEAVGPGVDKVRPGDSVLLTFDSCGHCPRCTDNEPAYCHHFPDLNFACLGPTGESPAQQDGETVAARFFGQSSFATYAIARERNVVPVSDEGDLATLAPLGCGIQTGVGSVLRSLNAQDGTTLVVFGGGAVGLSAVMAGVLAGCAAIILVEPTAARRNLARELGAHHSIDPTGRDIAEAVRQLAPGGADIILDTSGNQSALGAALAMLAPKGRLGLVGVPAALDACLPVPIVPAITFGYEVKGIIEGDSDPDTFLPELVALHRSGQLPFDRFVTFYPFAEIDRAMADVAAGACVKAVLLFD